MQDPTQSTLRRFPKSLLAPILFIPLAASWFIFQGTGDESSKKVSAPIPTIESGSSSTSATYEAPPSGTPSVPSLPATSSPGETTQTPPVSDPIDSAEPVEPTVDASLYVGLTVEEATAVALDAGFYIRVVSVDGESFQVTADYRTDRLNLTVVAGKVSSVQVG
jgi:hypothetical protein